MIAEITPLVQAADTRVWRSAAMAHAVGAVVSAGVLGLILGAGGGILGVFATQLTRIQIAGIGTGVAALILVACAAREAGLVRIPMPSLHRQTPQWFKREFGPVWSGLLWGADLGQGWTTHILYTGYYGLVAWAILGANPATSAIAFAAFGLGRALPVIVAGLRTHRDPTSVSRMFLLRQPVLQQLNAVGLALTGVLLLRAAFLGTA